jgi:hypothetical protein
VGPGPLQGQLLALAREAATERKESKHLRDITDTSTLLSAVKSLKGNTFNKKPFVPKKNFPKKGNQKTYCTKPQGDRRQVYFQEGAYQRAAIPIRNWPKKNNPKETTKDQKQPFRGNKKSGGSNQQQHQQQQGNYQQQY